MAFGLASVCDAELAALALAVPASVVVTTLSEAATAGRALGLVLVAATYALVLASTGAIAHPGADQWRLWRPARVVAIGLGSVEYGAKALFSGGAILAATCLQRHRRPQCADPLEPFSCGE